MLGAIIGDLAVWTYEHDRECFWQHLVSNEAKVSEFGLSVIATTAMLRQDIKWSRKELLVSLDISSAIFILM